MQRYEKKMTFANFRGRKVRKIAIWCLNAIFSLKKICKFENFFVTLHVFVCARVLCAKIMSVRYNKSGNIKKINTEININKTATKLQTKQIRIS